MALGEDALNLIWSDGDVRVNGGFVGLSFIHYGSEGEPHYFRYTPRDLVITALERDRFGQEHGLAKPANTQAKLQPTSWKDEAREHYAKLRDEYPNLSKQQLAEKIAPLMQAKQRGNNPVQAANIMRNALQNI
jgi:hypothetical protein